jgi:proline iminopeptidase
MLPLKKLAENVRPVVLYDQLGSGASVIDESYAQDPKPLWTIARFTKELAAVIDALGYKQVYLLGHSWGSTLAFEYYKGHADRVLGLIFQGAFFSGKTWDADAQKLLSTVPEPYRSALVECSKSDDAGMWNTEKCSQADEAYSQLHLNRQRPWSEDMNDGPINFDPKYPYLVMNGPNEFHASGSLGKYEVMDQLSKIQVPTLFISGQYDEVPVSTARKYARAMDAKLNPKRVQVKELPNASHLGQLEQTDRYLKIVGDFLL